MRIAYTVGGIQKSLIIEDRVRIAAVVSKMSVLETSDFGIMRSDQQGGTVQFFMSDGSVDGFGFISPTVLYGGDWGRISLRSTDFYDRLSELVSQAAGRKITLPKLQEQKRREH